MSICQQHIYDFVQGVPIIKKENKKNCSEFIYELTYPARSHKTKLTYITQYENCLLAPPVLLTSSLLVCTAIKTTKASIE